MRRFTIAAALFTAMLSVGYAQTGAASKETPKAAAPSQSAAKKTEAREPLAIANGPYLLAPSETGVTVAWRTNNKCLSWVAYRVSNDTSPTVVFNSHHGLRDANTTIHAVRIDGLKPGTTYQYHVVSREIDSFAAYKVVYGEEVRSADYKFKTLDRNKPDCSFVVLNDRHEKVEPLTASLNSIKWDLIDLAFLNGDMMSAFEREEQAYEAVVDPCAHAFAKTIPFLYVRGNHEARGSLARRFLDYFPTESGRFYYSFTDGPVHFTVLDCGEDKPDASKEYYGLADFDRYRDAEAAWLKKEVAGKDFRNARFRVVFVHMPPFVSGKESDQNHGRENMVQKFGPLLAKARVDLMISAHTHRFARVAPEKGRHDYPILVGNTTTVIGVNATGEAMKVVVREGDGTVKDEFVIAKRPGFWGRLFGAGGR